MIPVSFFSTLVCVIFLGAQEIDSVKSRPLSPINAVKKILPNDSTISNRTDSTTRDTTTLTLKKDTIDYTADVIEYDTESKTIFLQGNGVVKYENMTLFADSIHLVFDKNLLIATGMPQLVQGKDTMSGESMVYNLKTHHGRIRYGTSRSNTMRHNGNEIIKTKDKELYIANGSYTDCEADTAHYFFYGKMIKVVTNDKAITRPVVLNISGAPVLALPYYILPLDKERRSGWLKADFGGNPSTGGYISNFGYYWALSDYFDLELSTGINEFSRFSTSLKSRYALRYRFTGNISGTYGYSIDETSQGQSGTVTFNHNQPLLPDNSFNLTANGTITSNKTFYRTHTPNDTANLLTQNTTAGASLSKTFSQANINTNLNWKRTHNLRTNEVSHELPTFNVNFGTRALFPQKKDNIKGLGDDNNKKDDEEKWYEGITYSYSIDGGRKLSFYKKDPNVGRKSNEEKYDLAGIGHRFSLNTSFKLFKYINVSPNFSFRQSLANAYVDTNSYVIKTNVPVFDTLDADSSKFFIVTDTILPIDNGTNDTLYECVIDTILDTARVYDTLKVGEVVNGKEYKLRDALQAYDWSTGVNLSTTIYGVFPIQVGKLRGIRHTFSPSIGYTFTPKKELPWRYLNTPGSKSVSAREKRSQSISFGFSNSFDIKLLQDTDKKKKEQTFDKKRLLSNSINFSYDFEKEVKKLSDISTSLDIPNKLVNFSFNSSFTPYDQSYSLIVPKLMNYSVSLSPKLNSLQGYLWGGDFIFLENLAGDDYEKETKLRDNPTWSASISPSYSFRKARASLLEPFKTTKTYSLSSNAKLNFTHQWSVSWGSSYDFTEGKFSSQSLAFNCDLGDWNLDFNWTPSGVSAGSFSFKIFLKKQPEIKWEEKS